MLEKKVSDIFAEFLQSQRIHHVFGIVGAGNAQIFDAITRLGFTKIICVHHEQAAVMAATTYYRMTGKVTIVLLTTGAGSTNGVTGVVSAWMDSMPVLVISGNENSRFTTAENSLRIWGVQGYDSTQMVEKVTKWTERIMRPEQALNVISRAYAVASASRPGPVWIDIPMNIQAALVSLDKLEPVELVGIDAGAGTVVDMEADQDRCVNCQTGLHIVKEMLSSAERPVLWLGNGIRFAGAEHRVLELVERLGIPVLVSWQACDILDSNHPLCFGRAGVYGQRAANFVLQNCDALICIGTRLAIPQVGYDLTEFARAAKIAMVDIDVKELLKLGDRIHAPILSDAGKFIEQLLSDADNSYSRSEWITQCEAYRQNYPVVGPEHADMRDDSGTNFINSYRFMEILEKYFHDDQIVVTDMGTALLSGHQVLKFKPGQRMLTSTGLGEMGFGLPGAIGAAIGANREVLCLNCDGGMMLNLQELQTIAHHKLPIKIIIFNNDGYLMIKHTQKALFSGRYSGSDRKSGVTCPDFAKVAYAFSIPSFQIRTWEDVEAIVPRMQAINGPVICEVFTHPEQPFVPKLSLVQQKDGSIISPPLEDLSPLLSRDEMRKNMLIGLHQKSNNMEISTLD
ncbi:MAG: thiamine pyrophosphate-binding protein [Gallionella sp.]|nr:thiamine pyrophosphate-binding protein [Gallionella sp.]